MTSKYKLIRGARIIQQMTTLNERSFASLQQNTNNFVPPSKKRQNAVQPVQVSRVELVPARPSQALTAKVLVVSNSNKYQTSIMFQDVIYEDGDQSDNTTFTATDGEEYHIVPIDLSKSNVKVHCNCLDFYYRFAPSNNKDDSLLGNPPPPYQRKTTTRPPVNPQQTPGVCKHLIRAISALREVRITR